MTGAVEQPVTGEDLRPVDLFEELDDSELAEWAAAAHWQRLEPGEVLIEYGQEFPGLLLLLEGTLQTFARDGERLVPTAHQTAPTWIGAIPTLTETPVMARLVAIDGSRLAVIPAVQFRRLALAYPSVYRRVMQQVRPLMSRITSLEQNRERLESLGTMAAGLAHELNNPASAARRSAAQLADALDVIGSTLREFVDAGIERDDAARIADLRDQAVHQGAACSALSALDRADAEDEMQAQLEAMGVSEAWAVAEPLVLAGVDQNWLSELNRLAGAATPAALRSIAASVNAQRLVTELREATDQMSTLISAVKSYAYMDRGELVKADIHEGLETTVSVLGHKLKHTQIEIERDYDRTLPQLTIAGSALNQVWTNLIDNAIDAIGDTPGTITLRTRRDGDCALVEIADTGPGIPASARGHVFEPFFTTKDVGHGTGLGLDTAKRIVEQQHAGTLSFETGDEGTTFQIWLPLG